jgi:O-antigen/teichoic acid export membrane protein
MAQRDQARTLAAGSLAQQAAQVTGLLAMFAIITVLARRLSLAELGAYGLLTSVAGYLLIVQNAAAGGAVRAMAGAPDDAARSAAYSTAVTLYALAGLAAGALVALLGVGLMALIDVSGGVRHQAQLGSLLLGVVTAVGWPLTITRDALRASQRFVRAAMTEMGALLLYVALVLGLVYAGGSLSLVIGASGTIPLLVGLGCAVVARVTRLPYRFRRGAIDRHAAREVVGVAGYLSLTEAAAAAIYAVNRAILGLFRSAATVGLIEGPIRAHNLVRSLNGAVIVTALPTASRYRAEDDERRLAELLLRGARYTLALVVPLTVTGMLLAAPVLDVWLGDRFRTASGAMAILMSHWLVNGCSGLLIAVLAGVGRARDVARYAVAVAVLDVVLAVALTPLLGLEGVAIATSLPYIALFPVLLRWALVRVPVDLGSLLREAFLPAYALGAVLALALAGLRLAWGVEGLAAVAATALLAPLAYWAAYYLICLDAAERRLVREVALDLIPLRRLRASR